MNVEEYTKFAEEYNKQVEVYNIIYKQANELERSGNISQAITLYEKLIISDVNMYGAHNRLVVIYRKEKDFENELRVILKAIEQATFHWSDYTDKLQEFTPDWPVSEASNIVDQRYRVNQIIGWVERLTKLLALELKHLEKRYRKGPSSGRGKKGDEKNGNI